MTRTLQDALNQANPNHVGDGLAALPAGVAMALLTRYELLSAGSPFPVGGTPAAILAAFGRTSGTWFLPVAPESTPGAGEIAVAPNGGLAGVGAEAAGIDLWYLAMEGTLINETLEVVAGVATFLGGKSCSRIFTATIDSGLVGGGVVQPAIVARGSTPGSGECALSLDGKTVSFHADDVVTGVVKILGLTNPTTTVGSRLATAVAF